MASDRHETDEKAPERPDAVAEEELERFDEAEDELVHLFLEQQDDRPAKIAFLITSAIFIVMFLSTFPEGDKMAFDQVVIYVPEIEEYVPPVKEPPKIERIEKQKVKKVALPDPTPEEPEPIVEPTPEPEPEPLPPNVVIKRGIPHGPPRGRGGPVTEGTAGLTPPQLIKEPDPCYPEIARRAGVGGLVVVRAIIGRDGRVNSAEVRAGIGKFGLDECALEAVKKRVYKAGELEGRPVEVISTIRVNFVLP